MIATYTFCIACVFGRQYTENTSDDICIDLFFPSWTIMELLFYIGLLKVFEHIDDISWLREID